MFQSMIKFPKLLILGVVFLTTTLCNALDDDHKRDLIQSYDKSLIQNLKKASTTDIKFADEDFENAAKNVITSCYITWGGDVTEYPILMTWASYHGGIIDDNRAIYNHLTKCFKDKTQMLKTIDFQDWQISALQGAIQKLFTKFDKDPNEIKHAKTNGLEVVNQFRAMRKAPALKSAN